VLQLFLVAQKLFSLFLPHSRKRCEYSLLKLAVSRAHEHDKAALNLITIIPRLHARQAVQHRPEQGLAGGIYQHRVQASEFSYANLLA
jgi:hypothetical protein